MCKKSFTTLHIFCKRSDTILGFGFHIGLQFVKSTLPGILKKSIGKFTKLIENMHMIFCRWKNIIFNICCVLEIKLWEMVAAVKGQCRTAFLCTEEQ